MTISSSFFLTRMRHSSITGEKETFQLTLNVLLVRRHAGPLNVCQECDVNGVELR